jgi:uncharacterized Ntn-hydrolase superfamily protein
MRKILPVLFVFFLSVSSVLPQDTFSIVAIDPLTGQVGSAGASCVGDCTILTDVHPGKGVIHTQASYLAANQNYARALMNAGCTPQQIIDSMVAHDVQNNPTVRQYGVIDMVGTTIRTAAYTGVNCMNYKNHIIGPNYTIQGNILLGQKILDSMEARFNRMNGSLAQKLMAALQGAKVVGADTRCSSNNTSSLSAFIRVARVQDTLGTLYLNLKVLNAQFNRDPIDSLQVLFNQWNPSGVMQLTQEIPQGIELFQNYPNPFNSSTKIKFSVNVNSNVRLSIYGIRGELVADLLNENLNEGTYELEWNVDKNNLVSSGVYFIRLDAEGVTKTRKISVIK